MHLYLLCFYETNILQIHLHICIQEIFAFNERRRENVRKKEIVFVCSLFPYCIQERRDCNKRKKEMFVSFTMTFVCK